MNKLKKGDQVIVIAGSSRGLKGSILGFDGDDRVLVQGVNLQSKAVKPNPRAGVEGGLIRREGSVHISNINILNPVSGKADRVGFKAMADGKLVRVYKSSQEEIK